MNITFHRWPGGSGEIRGRQVAEYLGAALGMMPDSRPNGGINIWVKGEPPEDYPRGRSYLDMMDAPERMPWVSRHPDIGLIGISKTAVAWMHRKLGEAGCDRDIAFIPEHHCNYNREQRQRTKVETVGVIGNRNAFHGITHEIVRQFEDMGLRFLYHTDVAAARKMQLGRPQWMTVEQNLSRESVLEFYRQIDIQVVWRPHLRPPQSPLRNPLKLENAGSFGIPTVAFPEPDYVEEFDGAFLPATSLEQMFAAVKYLRDDPVYYHEQAEVGRERAERYHIEYTSKRYLCLT